METATADPTATAERNSASAISSTDDFSFAEMLASLSTPPKFEAPWNDDALADDVATISYNRALQGPGRLEAEPEKLIPDAGAIPEKPQAAATPKPLKTASITIRLSAPECAQLRQRAAEAGLTISAYLRSCTLEVESLRAQVKEALAQLKTAPVPASEPQADERRTGGLRSALIRFWRWLGCFRRNSEPAVRVNPANPFAPVRFN